MTAKEIAAFVERQRPLYAEDLVRTRGLSAAEAAEQASGDYGILAAGAPPNHHLFVIEDDVSGRRMGDLWFGPSPGGRPGTAYLYDIVIDERLRRRGLGRQAMSVFEETAARMGFQRLGLHVFADNEPARSLYRSLG